MPSIISEIQMITMSACDAAIWASFRLSILYTSKRSEHVLFLQTITIRDALNSALDEEMARDGDVFILGEEVSDAFVVCAFHVLLIPVHSRSHCCLP